jgi:galactokinase
MTTALRRDFGRAPDAVACAPGRVNLIGEHTDYTGGFVLPMAIPQTTEVAVARRNDAVVQIVTDAFGRREASFSIDAMQKVGDWIDYVQGTIAALHARGFVVRGFDATITSCVPVGSGLSSSAALEVALLRALREAFALPVDDLAIAVIGRAAETDFVGAPIGIMDQMASSLGDAESALFIDTRTLAYERIPVPRAIEVVVIDSGVSHEHATGDYATRRAECERATALLGASALRDVTDASAVASLPEPLARRARHVITENARVVEAASCMKSGDTRRLGQLLDASHASLRDDFEVSTADVDRLVAIAQRDEDVLGARMTGGGFGGAIVALAPRGRGQAAAERIVCVYDAGGLPRGRALVAGAPMPDEDSGPEARSVS